MANLIRVSKVKPDHQLPFTRSTLYKLKHLRRYPGLFVKVGSALFVDREQLERVIEAGRVK